MAFLALMVDSLPIFFFMACFLAMIVTCVWCCRRVRREFRRMG